MNYCIVTPMPGPVKRRYDTTRRSEAAARTRVAILDAARQLFTERGYAATPMSAIEYVGAFFWYPAVKENVLKIWTSA